MSFSSIINSIFGAKPVDLYEFTHGSTAWRYCGGQEDITFSGNVFSKFPVKRTSQVQESEMAKDSIKISIPLDSPVSQLYLSGSPESIVGITIYRAHYGDSEVICAWKGRIVLPVWNEFTCELSCESIYTKSRKQGCRARVTRQCRVDLYGAECGLSKASYGVAALVTDVDSTKTVITVSAATSGVSESGRFTGGELSSGTSTRTILKHEGGTIKLMAPILDMSPGGYVSIYPGCDRTLATCTNRYNNRVNYRGCPWLPNKDPYVSRIA